MARISRGGAPWPWPWGKAQSPTGLPATAECSPARPLGGLLSTYLGLTAPFWLGFAPMTVVSTVVWDALGRAGGAPLRRPSGAVASLRSRRPFRRAL